MIYRARSKQVELVGATPEAAHDVERLNLNHPRLTKNRYEILARLKRDCDATRDGWTPASLKRKRQALLKPDREGRLPEFVGMLVDYIERKLRQQSAR